MTIQLRHRSQVAPDRARHGRLATTHPTEWDRGAGYIPSPNARREQIRVAVDQAVRAGLLRKPSNLL